MLPHSKMVERLPDDEAIVEAEGHPRYRLA
jgi:hypothetical protein